MRRGLRLLAVLFLLACAKPSKREAPHVSAASAPLKAALQRVGNLPPCDTLVPMEWPYSWPVPVEDARGKLFKVLFYPYSGNPGEEYSLMSPGAEAVIDISYGKPVSCKKYGQPSAVLSHRRWPAAISSWGMKEFKEHEAALLAKTEAVAALYNSNRPLSAADSALAGAYADAFQALAEPDLLPYYYRMNPAFWEWLRKAGGKSIPKAS